MLEKAMDMASGLKKYLTVVLKLSLAAALLIWVLSQVDWGAFFETIADAHAIWIGAVLAVDVADRFFMSAKWKYLLEKMGVHVGLSTALTHNLRGGLAERVVQWGVGGDITRTAGLSRDTGQPGPVVLSVIIEKIVGLSALGSLAAVSFCILNFRVGFVSWQWLFPVSLLCIGGLFALPFVMMEDRVVNLTARIGRAIPFEVGKTWTDRLSNLKKYWCVDPRALLVFYGLTAVEQLVSTVNLLLLGNAFGISVTVVGAFSVMPIATFFSRLPITTQALGVREGLYVLMLGFIGIGAAEAFAIALTVRVSHTVVFGVGALLTAPFREKEGKVVVNRDS